MPGDVPCAAGIIAALDGENEGEFLADYIEDRKVIGVNAANEEVYEYLIHYASFPEPGWTKEVSFLLKENYKNRIEQEKADKATASAPGASTSSSGAAGAGACSVRLAT